jgi:hypothetical protein
LVTPVWRPNRNRLDDLVGRGEAAVRISGLVAALEGQIVAERGMDHRRVGGERGFGIGDGRQFLVIDNDEGARILGLRPRARHHGGNRLALPARPVDDGVLRRRLDALEMGEHADPWRDHLGKLGAGDHGHDARCPLGRARIDRLDVRMGVGRTHENHMRHAGHQMSLT